MSDKVEKKTAPAAAAAPAGDKKEAAKEAGGIGKMLGKTPVLLGAVMLMEAAVLIAGFKVVGGGGPKTAVGAEIVSEKSGEKGGEGTGGGVDPKGPVEIQLVDFRAPNKQSGRTFLYDVAIYVTTKTANQDKVKELISGRDALIKDRVRTIIAEIDPEKLNEPGLETLRRQVKNQLDQIVGENLIDEVLVPRCIAFRTQD